MPEIDDELVARAVRWCDAAGQRASPEEVRAALAPLSWDQLLAVRACLADPPPAILPVPLPLAYLRSGASPATCSVAEREPPGQPPPPGPEPAHGEIAPSRSTHRRAPTHRPVGAPSIGARQQVPRQDRSATRGPGAPRGGARAARPVGPIIHRAGDRPPPSTPAAPVQAPLDELSRSEGRATLEQLVREHGARRGPLLEAMRQRWRRADGGAPDDEDLTRLLAEHGLSRAFARRERDEILHALRAAGGDRRRAATATGLATAEALDAAVARLGATAQAESIREAARVELRRRATLTERARLLLREEEYLRDLGLLTAIESDLAGRLPEHLRALRASGAGPLDAALGRSLSLRPADAQVLVRRLGLDVEAIGAGGARDRRDPRLGQRDAKGRSRSSSRPRPRPSRGAGRTRSR